MKTVCRVQRHRIRSEYIAGLIPNDGGRFATINDTFLLAHDIWVIDIQQDSDNIDNIQR